VGLHRVMARVHRDKLLAFQEELIKLYSSFEGDVEALCKKHSVQLQFWYSPSMIPQPKFIIEGVGFDADEILEKNFVLPPEIENKENVKSGRYKKRKVRKSLEDYPPLIHV